jgi:hypothetical protein
MEEYGEKYVDDISTKRGKQKEISKQTNEKFNQYNIDTD